MPVPHWLDALHTLEQHWLLYAQPEPLARQLPPDLHTPMAHAPEQHSLL